MALTANKVIYTSHGSEYAPHLEFEIRSGLTLTIAQADAVATAFFDELENQFPCVSYVTKSILGDDQISGNFWEQP
jgi:hypothetical protein